MQHENEKNTLERRKRTSEKEEDSIRRGKRREHDKRRGGDESICLLVCLRVCVCVLGAGRGKSSRDRLTGGHIERTDDIRLGYLKVFA